LLPHEPATHWNGWRCKGQGRRDANIRGGHHQARRFHACRLYEAALHKLFKHFHRGLANHWPGSILVLAMMNFLFEQIHHHRLLISQCGQPIYPTGEGAPLSHKQTEKTGLVQVARIVVRKTFIAGPSKRSGTVERVSPTRFPASAIKTTDRITSLHPFGSTIVRWLRCSDA
jgi:hypothetical protein